MPTFHVNCKANQALLICFHYVSPRVNFPLGEMMVCWNVRIANKERKTCPRNTTAHKLYQHTSCSCPSSKGKKKSPYSIQMALKLVLNTCLNIILSFPSPSIPSYTINMDSSVTNVISTCLYTTAQSYKRKVLGTTPS